MFEYRQTREIETSLLLRLLEPTLEVTSQGIANEMAHSKSALKRWHQSLKARERNRSRRSFARNSVRSLREAAASGDGETLRAALGHAYSALDTAAKNGAIHTGKADRTKRRLAALVARTLRAPSN